MNQYNHFWNIIEILDKNKLLQHLVLIGSWVEYIYKESGLLKDFNASLRTRDVDFLIRNIRKPDPPVNIFKLLSAEGYNADLSDGGYVKFYKEPSLEIEFLATEKGKGKVALYRTNMGIDVEGLRELNFINENAIDVKIRDHKIFIPTPEAYVLHKIIINHERNSIKREKDMRSIELIIDEYFQANSELNKRFMFLLKGMTKKQQEIVKDYIIINNITLHLNGME